MALVDDRDVVGREVVEERRRRLARRPAREVAGVVLDAGAVADLPHHLEVEPRPLLEPLGLEELLLRLELLEPHRRARPRSTPAAALPHLLGRHVVRLRVEVEAREPLEDLARQEVEAGDLLDLVAEELHPHARVLVRRVDLEDVAAHAERPAVEVEVRPLVLRLDEPLQVPRQPVARAGLELDRHLAERLGAPEAVDARDRGHDQDVAPLEERGRRRDPQLVDLVVDLGFLLDVGVRLRDVGLGLVVVVVGDEVLDPVLREEPLELLVELRGERLVVREDERGAVERLDDLRHRERLPRAGDAEEDLVLLPLPEARGRAPRSPPAGRPGASSGETTSNRRTSFGV